MTSMLTTSSAYTCLMRLKYIESGTPCTIAQVKLQLVGFDAMLLVEGRELLYAKLLDVDAFLTAAPLGGQPAPGEPRLSLALNAGDVALRDMQVLGTQGFRVQECHGAGRPAKSPSLCRRSVSRCKAPQTLQLASRQRQSFKLQSVTFSFLHPRTDPSHNQP
jgi:hypothetical protein